MSSQNQKTYFDQISKIKTQVKNITPATPLNRLDRDHLDTIKTKLTKCNNELACLHYQATGKTTGVNSQVPYNELEQAFRSAQWEIEHLGAKVALAGSRVYQY